MIVRLASVLLLALLPGPAVQGGAISGVVSDSATRQPVSGAIVRLHVVRPDGRAEQHGPRQVADSTGRFVFVGLPAGSFHVLATAPGYFDGRFAGASGSSVMGRLELQEKQWVQDAHIALSKPAAISGMVRDDKGDPLVDVPVRILSAFRMAGREQWAAGVVTLTDDRGEYRFAGLQPGRYTVLVPNVQVTLPDGHVSLYRRATTAVPAIRGADGVGTMAGYFAVAPPGRGVVFPATFYPGASVMSGAGQIEVGFGEHRTGTDITLHPVSTASVAGIVTGPPAAVSNLPVRLLTPGNELLGFGGETAVTLTDPAGRFLLANVPIGDYTIIAGRSIAEIRKSNIVRQADAAPTAANPFIDSFSGSTIAGVPDVTLAYNAMSGQDATGRVSVSVGASGLEDVVVPARAGAVVSGKVRLDGADVIPSEGQAATIFRALGPRVGLDPIGDAITTGVRYSSPGPRESDLDFAVHNVPAGRYHVVANIEGYAIVRATWNGRDLFSEPLEVTDEPTIDGLVVELSSKKTGVAGVVRTTDGRGPSTAVVYVFPRERSRWGAIGVRASLFRMLEVPSTGVFTTDGMVPGDYLVAALSHEHRTRGIDQELLMFLADHAGRITVAEGTTQSVDLRIVEWRR